MIELNVSETIKAELINGGRTQAWLTRRINEAGIKMNTQRLSAILNGKRILTADEFVIICKILNLTIDSFDYKKAE